jgi:hypothetical protein
MTNHAGRLYVLAASLAVFFLLWAVIAAHPWAGTTKDPRLTALAQREQSLRREATLVRQVLAARAAAAQAAKARAKAQSAATSPAPAPRVRVVTLPPLTITRTS